MVYSRASAVVLGGLALAACPGSGGETPTETTAVTTSSSSSSTGSPTTGTSAESPTSTSSTSDLTSSVTTEPLTSSSSSGDLTSGNPTTSDPTTETTGPTSWVDGNCEHRGVNGDHVVWGLACGTPLDDWGESAVIPDPDGIVVMATIGDTVFELGGTLHPPLGSYDVLVAHLDGAGAPLSTRRWGGEASDSAGLLARLPGGGLVMSLATSSPTLKIGEQEIAVDLDLGGDLLIATDAQGDLTWYHEFSDGTGGHYVAAIATNAAGKVAVFYKRYTINDDEAVLAMFDAAGKLEFTRVLSGYSWQFPGGVTFTDNGVLVVGSVEYDLVLDGPEPPEAMWGPAAFVIQFDTTGKHLWTRFFPRESSYGLERVALAPGGDILFGGSFDTKINLGGDTLYAYDAHPECNPNTCRPDVFEGCEEDCFYRTDVFVARLDPEGGHLWSRQLSSDYDDSIQAIGGLADDRTIVLWSLYNDNGPGTVQLAAFDSGGQPTVSATLPMANPYRGAIDPTGIAVVVGAYENPIDFGTGKVDNQGGYDAWFARLEL